MIKERPDGQTPYGGAISKPTVNCLAVNVSIAAFKNLIYWQHLAGQCV
jgi:hypothetical protein